MSLLYSSIVLALQPTAYYRFNETSGTTATDAAANANNGTYTGVGITYSQTGAITGDPNNAVLLNGSTGDMACPSGVNPTGWSTLTVECWVKFTNVTFITTPTIFASAISGTSHTGFNLWLDASGAGIHFDIGNGTTSASAHWSTTLSASTYYHIVGTWDGSTITLYVNGTSRATASLSGTIASAASAPIVGHNPAGSSDFLPGTVDELSIGNYTLSSGQVSEHYTVATASNGLYAVSTSNTIFAADVLQIINVLQKPTGGQEFGKYDLNGSVYTTNGIISVYIPSLSRTSVPVSVTTDTADVSPPAWFNAVGTTHLTHGGFEVSATFSSANTGGTAAGNYTIQY